MTLISTNKPLIHLWIYNHPFHGISDQIDFFLMIMRQNGYKVSVGREPRTDALNVVIENFSEVTSQILIDFCSLTGKRVAVIMTEHLDFIREEIYIHGEPLWNNSDYMAPATQVARIKNLMDCAQFIRCFFVLGDLPELINFKEMLPGLVVRTLPFPRLQSLSRSESSNNNGVKADAIFTGVITNYRENLLNLLDRKISVTCPGTFVSRRVRDNLNQSGKIVLNLPQRADWSWLSLMRIIAALRCGRATISLGTADNSRISACCIQLDITKGDWMDRLREYVSQWDTVYQRSFENYEDMAISFERENPFPQDVFDYWEITDRL
jgi:hypothetical protein